MSKPLIAIVDYGMGNRRSVEKALEHVGARITITADQAELDAADGLVLPGVGAFPQAMRNIRERGLEELLQRRTREGTPLLGLCLGMQLPFTRSVEWGGEAGLGIVEGEIRELQVTGLKLPHIGWNEVHWTRPSALTEGLPDPCAFYHVHTYAAYPADDEIVLGRGDYGGPFVSVVEQPPFYGVQFHPEKSSVHGLKMLENFSAICARVAA